MGETVSSGRPAGITCARYVRAGAEGKRCKHYLANGSCALPDELVCVEWLKANGHRQPERDLFGNPLPSPPASKPARPPREADAPVTPRDPEPGPPPGLTTADIESFKALGVEVCVRSEDLGELWLVPTYTGKPRRELTPEHLATIARVLETFPGARVTAFEKLPADSEEKGSPS